MGDGFFGLLPEVVLDAAERSGTRATGRIAALNSLENRVYDVELEGGRRLIAKFYRPGRWDRATILDEHAVLLALVDEDFATAAPIPFPDGDTLARTPDGIWFALFPRVLGRAAGSLEPPELGQLGQLVARIHNVTAPLPIAHRPALSPASYGRDSLDTLLAGGFIPGSLEARFAGVRTLPINADLHRGNLLEAGPRSWIILDFDDLASGPAVQDLWLLLPARPEDCPEHLAALVEGYEQFRVFDPDELVLVEVLRGLRYVRYAAWVASRWSDPSFPRAFPGWGSERYWSEQISDISEQLEVLSR